MQQGNPKLNASGYNDPVAYEAIRRITKEDNENNKNAAELIRVIKRLVRGSGYEVIGRIIIKDIKSGKEYR